MRGVLKDQSTGAKNPKTLVAAVWDFECSLPAKSHQGHRHCTHPHRQRQSAGQMLVKVDIDLSSKAKRQGQPILCKYTLQTRANGRLKGIRIRSAGSCGPSRGTLRAWQSHGHVHQPLVAAPFLRTTSLQTFLRPQAQAFATRCACLEEHTERTLLL